MLDGKGGIFQELKSFDLRRIVKIDQYGEPLSWLRCKCGSEQSLQTEGGKFACGDLLGYRESGGRDHGVGVWGLRVTESVNVINYPKSTQREVFFESP
jgi:hypothetical protein